MDRAAAEKFLMVRDAIEHRRARPGAPGGWDPEADRAAPFSRSCAESPRAGERSMPGRRKTHSSHILFTARGAVLCILPSRRACTIQFAWRSSG